MAFQAPKFNPTDWKRERVYAGGEYDNPNSWKNVITYVGSDPFWKDKGNGLYETQPGTYASNEVMLNTDPTSGNVTGLMYKTGAKEGSQYTYDASGNPTYVGQGSFSTNPDWSWVPGMLAMYGGAQLAQGMLGNAATGAAEAGPGAAAGFGSGGNAFSLDPSVIYGPGSGWGGDTLSALDELSGAAPGTAASANGILGQSATTSLGNVIPNNPTQAGTFSSAPTGTTPTPPVTPTPNPSDASKSLLPAGVSQFFKDNPWLLPAAGGILSFLESKDQNGQQVGGYAPARDFLMGQAQKGILGPWKRY